MEKKIMIDDQQRVTALIIAKIRMNIIMPKFKRKCMKITFYPLTNSAKNSRKFKLLT